MTTGMNLWDTSVWSFVLTLSVLFAAMIAANVLRNSFDSIILSAFLGLDILARYQNYLLIVTTLVGITANESIKSGKVELINF